MFPLSYKNTIVIYGLTSDFQVIFFNLPNHLSNGLVYILCAYVWIRLANNYLKADFLVSFAASGKQEILADFLNLANVFCYRNKI